MLVVADTSPLIGLAKIDHLVILPRLYGQVVIPIEVANELSSPRRTDDVRRLIDQPPAWLLIRSTSNFKPIVGLDAGESAAISLVEELKADVLLIDEIRGRTIAIERGIFTVRTAALLVLAAEKGIVADLKLAFDRLKATDFHIQPRILDELLRQYLSSR